MKHEIIIQSCGIYLNQKGYFMELSDAEIKRRYRMIKEQEEEEANRRRKAEREARRNTTASNGMSYDDDGEYILYS